MSRNRKQDQQLDALILKFEGLIGAAFLSDIAKIRAGIVLKQIVELIKQRDIAGVIEALGINRSSFALTDNASVNAYVSSGIVLAAGLLPIRKPNGDRVVTTFDARGQRASAWIANHVTGTIDGFVADQNKGIIAAAERGLNRQTTPNNLAREIVGQVSNSSGDRTGGLVGLSYPQTLAVSSAFDELASKDKTELWKYLRRELRDKRYDLTVLNAINGGTVITSTTAAIISKAYARKLLDARQKTIAETETLVLVSAAHDEAYRQGFDMAGRDGNEVLRTWRSVGDLRVRGTHIIMNGQTVQGMDTPFQSPSGAQLLYPGDMSLGAGPAEIVNCRCRVSYGF